jgi:hypothetical protein
MERAVVEERGTAAPRSDSRRRQLLVVGAVLDVAAQPSSVISSVWLVSFVV